MEDKQSPAVFETRYLDPGSCVFSAGPGGFLAAVIDGEEHKRVIASRALPLTAPDGYICLTDTEKNELGIIRSLDDFGGEQRELLEKELSLRYFCPVIEAINGVKEKMGHFYFDVTVAGKSKSFTVKDLTKSVRYHGKGFDIIDVDGNRFRVEDYGKIPPKSRKKIDAYLY